MTIEHALVRLSDTFGDQLSVAQSVLSQHAQNEAHFDKAPPDAVFFAKSAEDISTLMRICNEEKCPVTPWAAGTALEGQHLPIDGGVALNMMALNKVVEVSQEDMTAVVQPGVTRLALNDELRATGLFFSVDPGADASIGGMVATRASGTKSVRYGTIADNILALEVVLADGQIIRTGTHARKTAAGYNLTALMVGSEGTLGIITEVTLRLHGVSEAVSSASCAFDSVAEAVQAVVMTLQMGIPMARIELLDESYIEAVNDRADLGLPPKTHLFFEFHGTEAGVKEQAEAVGDIAKEFGGAAFDWASNAESQSRMWKARHSAYEAMKSKYPGHTSLVTDICVPISQLADAIDHARSQIAASSINGAVVGHVGDGNFHAQLMLKDGSEQDLAEAKRLSDEIAEFALSHRGTVTGEHGVGLGKQHLLKREHGAAIGVMQAIKQQLDPNNILNPGKIFGRS